MDSYEIEKEWREVSAELYQNIWQSVRDAGEEILEYNRDAVDVSDVADAITEQADALVPVYHGEQVREWYALGLPELEDSGMSDGSIFGGITGALFEWYHAELWQVVGDLLDERIAEGL
jgi:hypothetical protein